MMTNRPEVNAADLPDKAVVSRAYLSKLQAALRAGGDDAVFSALLGAVSDAIIQLDAALVALRERVEQLDVRTKGC